MRLMTRFRVHFRVPISTLGAVDDLFGEIATKNDYKLLHREHEIPDNTLTNVKPKRAKLYAEHVTPYLYQELKKGGEWFFFINCLCE